MRIVTAITQSNPAMVTTSFAHQYVDGTIIRLDIPRADGMQEANQLFGGIVVNGPTTFLIDIDTRYFEPFAIPIGVSPHINTCAMAVPIGELNSTLRASLVNTLNPNGLNANNLP